MDKIFKAVCDRYQIQVCNTHEKIKIAQNIRHQVYCEEMQFEEQNEVGLEENSYDNESIHLIIFDGHMAIGTVRIVISKILPLSKYIAGDHAFNTKKLTPGSYCEISRLSVLNRARKGEAGLAAAGLFFAAGYVVVRQKINTAYALMEESLARNMQKTGINSLKVSGPHELNGSRFIFMLDPVSFISSFASHTSFEESQLAKYFKKLGDFNVIDELSSTILAPKFAIPEVA